jgi:hypothetical protein
MTQTEINVPVDNTITSAKLSGALTTPAALTVSGALTGSNATFTTADNSDNLTLTSTDADAVSGPNVNFYRNSGSPADNDHLGEIRFTGRNDNSQDVIYANIETRIKDASDGSEDGYFDFETMLNGTLQSRLIMNETTTVFNEDSLDLDFRVESDNSTHALFVQGSDGKVGIGTSSPNSLLDLKSVHSQLRLTDEDDDKFLLFSYSGGKFVARNNSTTTQVNQFTLTEDGKFGLGTVSPGVTLDVNGGATTQLRLTASDSTSASIINFGDQANVAVGRIIYSHVSDSFSFKTNNVNDRMILDSSGNFLVAKTSSALASTGHTFGNDGYVYHTRAGDIMFLNRLSSNGALLIFCKDGAVTGTISTNANALPSDRNFKTNIRYDFALGLDFVNSLKPVTYNYKIDDADEPVMAGLIAQDVEQSLNEAGVAKNSMTMLQHKPVDDEKQSDYEMDYLKLVPVLINAIQEQQATIESQATAITDLTTRLTALEKN